MHTLAEDSKTSRMASPRELSAAFSTRVVRELSRPTPARWAWERVAPITALVGADAPLSVAFDAAYEVMVGEYRCEYVYKTALVRHVGESSPTAHSMIGLPVFLSIADVVVADRSVSAFEIKTDLDSYSRLELQLFSYASCFEHINVVTSVAKVSRVLAVVPDHVGVIALDESAALIPVRPSVGGYSRLEIRSLFQVLRQSERLAVLGRLLDYTADVPNALLYRRTAELFTKIPIEDVYPEFVAELRCRDAGKRAAAARASLPGSLVAAASGLNLSGVAWRRLGQLLQRPCGELRGFPLSGTKLMFK
ncbi:sce7726 family protein [Mycobacteroides abscessus]|nr:sce7726 family protein [Mycobacteroides abscessus]